MQILQWLFNVAVPPPRETSTGTTTTAASTTHPYNKRSCSDQTAKSNLVVVFNCCGSGWRFGKRQTGGKDFSPFRILRRRDIAKACFYSTLDLKKLGGFCGRRQQHCVSPMKKEDIARGLRIGHTKEDIGHGGKVLPINNDVASSTSSRNANEQCGNGEKKDSRLPKGDRTKTITRMKELLRWAAAAKAHEKGGNYISRKVLQFRNRGTLKAVPNDDQMSNESPKISFRWDLESCSTTSSVYSAFSMASSSTCRKNDQIISLPSYKSTPLPDDKYHYCSARPGSWITTDSEFVVLEL